MADDPIETIAVALEIYGIPQPAGSPPMTDTYLHVRRRQDGAAERAVMGLPAYQGEQGPAGPPGAIHQGERTTAQLNALAMTLGIDQTNWAYRNTDTDDQYVWTGQTFIVYHDVYATPGPAGPPPTMAPGTLTIDGADVTDPEFGVRVNGASGNYSVGIDLPPMPAGPKGDTGASGPVFTSVDVDQTIAKSDGDILVYKQSANKLQWSPGGYWLEEYVVPPSGFPTANKNATDVRAVLVTIVIPAKTFKYRFDFTGGVDINSQTGTQIDLEVRSNVGSPATPEVNGPLVGMGKGQEGEGWREVAFRAHSAVAIDPSSTEGVIQPGTEVTLYVSAVKKAGTLKAWGYRNTDAQLRVRLLRVR